MPRYFFDVVDGLAMRDDQGHECVDLAAAKAVAAQYAGELLLHAPARLWRDGDWTVFVRDDRGRQIFSIVILGMLAPAICDVMDTAASGIPGDGA